MDIFEFLDELKANNNREWFAPHKEECMALRETFIRQLQQLIDAMVDGGAAELKHLDARDCLYRIYRDTRFSQDKTPYKTYFSALISPNGRHYEKACYYIQIGADECGLYGGLWMPPSPMLRKVRRAIVDNIEEFEEIIHAPEIERDFPGWVGERLKTIPQGYDRNHPQAGLLRLKEYGKYHPCTRAFFRRKDWPQTAAKLLLELRPLCNFINYSIDEEE